MSNERRSPEPAGLAGIVHQADADGNQEALAPPQSPSFRRTPRIPPKKQRKQARKQDRQSRGLFASLFCCVSADPAASYAVNAPPYADLLPPLAPEDTGRKTLVLDLDETLVHSSFRPVPNADYVIPVNLEGTVHNVYVIKRPHVDEFLHRVGQHFEVVVFTASLAKYADPLLDLLDAHGVVKTRLFREHCTQHQGSFVKDLNRMGRVLEHTLIVDNSPASYLFHPRHAIACSSFIDNMHDRELLFIADFLETLVTADDVSKYTNLWNSSMSKTGNSEGPG